MGFSEGLKTEIRRKAHFSCCLCKDLVVEIHHIVPQSEGGADIEENAAPLCPSCHKRYGANPTKRKLIREARDLWFEICERRFASDVDRLEELKLLISRTPSLEDFKSLKNELLSLYGSPPPSIEEDELEEQRITFRGFWRGTWRNLVGAGEVGTEVVDVQVQVDGQSGQRIEGEFYDEKHPDIRFAFTGVYKMSFLRVRYKAPKGQKVMEDGDCFVRLQKDGNFAGYYANFEGCGLYELVRIS
jgi:hypothetical protein